jgi:hypothetical protein
VKFTDVLVGVIPPPTPSVVKGCSGLVEDPEELRSGCGETVSDVRCPFGVDRTYFSILSIWI